MRAVADRRNAHAQVPIRVVYLDRSMGAAMAGVGYDAACVNHHDFVPDELRQQQQQGGSAEGTPPLPLAPLVHLLYRPGHYDILYPLPAVAAAQSIAASS
jgi:ubiquitin thioesterase protein OTUB1